jgi:hypothetical protein
VVTDPRAVILVEGESDRGALEALAHRLGRDLATEGVVVVPIGGATNIRAALRQYDGLPLAGLVDAGEERAFARALELAGPGDHLDRAGMEARGFYVCVADLEDELIRALGPPRVEAVIEAQGELRSLRTLQKQPAQIGRTIEQQLRRFIGSKSGRKLRYARALGGALDVAYAPRPLVAVLQQGP